MDVNSIFSCIGPYRLLPSFSPVNLHYYNTADGASEYSKLSSLLLVNENFDAVPSVNIFLDTMLHNYHTLSYNCQVILSSLKLWRHHQCTHKYNAEECKLVNLTSFKASYVKIQTNPKAMQQAVPTNDKDRYIEEIKKFQQVKHTFRNELMWNSVYEQRKSS